MLKAQAHMMEYILLTLFIMIIIVALIFFLMSWQFTQLRASESKSEGEKALYLMKFFIKSPFFTKDESIFDDAKLDAFEQIQYDGGCEDLDVIFGRDWFATIYTLGGYESWTFCEELNRRSFSYVLPVNVYKNSEKINKLGVLEVGIYHEESPD